MRDKAYEQQIDILQQEMLVTPALYVLVAGITAPLGDALREGW
ncbi:hypothetical protein [Endozoicomonas numazuensis]|nr:hypothetical protein [Endozoicomonas numazuensis]